MTYLSMRLGALTALAVTSGCGLISSDVTDFDLTLPDKNFSVDATGWQVDDLAATEYLQTSCTSDTLCNSAVQQACAMDCSGKCDAQRCQLLLDVSLYRPVDLVTERPELKSINDEPVIKVTIDSVTYEVTSNSLTVPTPELKLYLAPMLVMNANDPMAKQIGTIAAVPAGVTTDGANSITFTDTGRAELISTMSNYKTPFNIIIGSTLIVASGQSVPMGKLDAVVHINAHAGL